MEYYLLVEVLKIVLNIEIGRCKLGARENDDVIDVFAATTTIIVVKWNS